MPSISKNEIFRLLGIGARGSHGVSRIRLDGKEVAVLTSLPFSQYRLGPQFALPFAPSSSLPRGSSITSPLLSVVIACL
jgi:hypothetical protein